MESIKDYEVNEAEEFWEILSPQRYFFSPQNRPIFRGQADSDWKLILSILRGQQPTHPGPQIHPSETIFEIDPDHDYQRSSCEDAAQENKLFVGYGMKTSRDD